MSRNCKLFFLFVFGVLIVNAQIKTLDLTEVLARVPASELPVSTGDKTKWRSEPRFSFNQDMAPALQFHSYEDLGMTKEFDSLGGGLLYGWAKSKYKYNMILIFMGELDCYRSVIGTFTKSGVPIDTLEVETSFQPGREFFYTKEFSLGTDQQLLISQLVSKEDRAIDAFDAFETYHAQRVDTYYQIDSNGKIVPLKRKLYKPRIYNAAYIKDGKKRLLDGDEEFEKEEIIQKE